MLRLFIIPISLTFCFTVSAFCQKADSTYSRYLTIGQSKRKNPNERPWFHRGLIFNGWKRFDAKPARLEGLLTAPAAIDDTINGVGIGILGSSVNHGLALGGFAAVVESGVAAATSFSRVNRGASFGMWSILGGGGRLKERKGAGIAIGVFSCILGQADGAVVGLFATDVNESDTLNGIGLGALTGFYDMRGVQIGIYNRAQKLKGLQIGLINYIVTNRRHKVLPFFNWPSRKRAIELPKKA